MLSVQKKNFEIYLNPVVKRLSRVSPNTLTLLGSIPPILFFVFIVNQLYVWGLIMLILSGFDMLDGMVARKYHKTTAFGGFLDSTVDRVADFLIITAFAFDGIVRWEIAAPLLLFAYLTSYVRSRGELANPRVSFAMGIIERPERLVLIFLALVFYMAFPTFDFINLNIAEVTFIFIAILSFYTVCQRIIHAYVKLNH
jgi:archaetidylinositol phosphate synthase